MGDSAVAEVTGEVVMEQASSTQTVTKRSVTSIQTTHIQSSHESSVRVESVVQGGSAEQTVAVKSVVQEGSAGQSLAVESSHVEVVTDIPKEEAPPVEESQPEPEPQPAEPQPVDENANAIPEEQEAQPEQEQAEEHAPEEHKEPAAANDVPAEAETAPAEEPAADAGADAEISQENIKSQLHEIISEIEEQVLPEHDEVHTDEIVESQQVDVEVTPAEETPPVEEAPASEEAVEAPAQEAPVQEAVEAPAQEVEEAVEAPAQEVEEAVEAPAQEVEEAPTQEVEAVVEAPAQEVAEVPAPEVEPVEEEDGVLHHTWRPKGKYELQKTAITYEDVVPIAVPEVSLKEPEPKPVPQPQPQQVLEQQQMPQVMQEPMHNGDMSPQVISPLEIPEGIPLLARILPKVDGEGDKKISLERLFTPATDSGDLTPKRTASRKMYSSSAFYRPDHPTIDDQVELAQRISFSLVDDNNKMSRGQSMYLKRKNRSMRWIHQGSGAGGEMTEEEMQRPLEKPPMKLLMNPKGVQDFQAVQEHYENLMNAPTSPDVGKIVIQNPVIAASPSGKGAELFAKRKKRMDKFIVDETTVQKAQQQTTSVQQTSSFSSSFSSSSKSVSSSSSFSSMKQAEMERNRQQEQIMEKFLKDRESSLVLVQSPWKAALETGHPDAAFDDNRLKQQLASSVVSRANIKVADAAGQERSEPVSFAAPPMGGAPTAPAAAPASGTGAIYTAEVKVVQRASLPPTPVDIPQHSLLDLVSQDSSVNKRRSLNFNLAAKGFGTYNNFYTPVTFAT
ncbi:probable serine/threonine-protein kinase kinX isoform X4 [Penaeus monodon]|uniref:probable serine/threonine-protein kinase kinX isoform X4 n=1 Tax=Penaeus monodon TaxID=6687 RepID=UPI0018A70FCE|nr:probable serine/threonine-protein kinase kinX isoform X4 [Penaeus monodon]